jgi:hypothetical protein
MYPLGTMGGGGGGGGGGSRRQPARVSDVEANGAAQGESDPLVPKSERADDRGTTALRTCCMLTAAAMAMSVLTLVVLSFALFTRVDGAVTEVTTVLAPHARGMVRNVARIMNNTATVTSSLKSMGDTTDRTLVASAPLVHMMLNRSAEMVANMHKYTSHSPTISIGPTTTSLG